jgi:26S proteasome regulatory subunit N1
LLDENDKNLPSLSDEDRDLVQSAAGLGLGIAYAGTEKEEVFTNLEGCLDGSLPLAAVSAISLGLAYVGSGNVEVAHSLVERLMGLSEEEMVTTHARLFSLAIGLIFMGQQGSASLDIMTEVLKAIDPTIGRFALLVVEGCAYAGSGDVLAVQRMLHICAEKSKSEEDVKKEADAAAAEADVAPGAPESDTPLPDAAAAAAAAAAGEAAAEAGAAPDADVDAVASDEPQPVEDWCQMAATFNIALMTFTERIGAQMAVRMMERLRQYGEAPIQRCIPLALAMLYPSNPEYSVIDTLSKMSHNDDERVAQSAIISLGVVGAGTNNSRIAQLLRALSAFYARETDTLYVVRIAQGLLHMGKVRRFACVACAQRPRASVRRRACSLAVRISRSRSLTCIATRAS